MQETLELVALKSAFLVIENNTGAVVFVAPSGGAGVISSIGYLYDAFRLSEYHIRQPNKCKKSHTSMRKLRERYKRGSVAQVKLLNDRP